MGLQLSTHSTTSKFTHSNNPKSTSTSGTSEYTDFQKVAYTFLNKSNVILFVWFLALYFVTYYTIGLFVRNYDNTSNIASQLSRTLDIIFLLTLMLFLTTTYFYYSNDDLFDGVKSVYTRFMGFVTDGWSVLSTCLFLVFFYVVLYLFQVPMTYETKPVFVSFIESFAWVLLLVIVFIQFFERVLDISIIDYLDDLDILQIKGSAKATDANETNAAAAAADKANDAVCAADKAAADKAAADKAAADKAAADKAAADKAAADKAAAAGGAAAGAGATDTNKPNCIKKTEKPTIAPTTQPNNQEVFNVSNNIYEYDDAAAVCSIYGAKLANYEQIEESYKDGAEWCNYGWSEGQMIYYPTQKETWNKLQKDPKMKNACGRPGINGGYINNPYLKFGVNCYGVKPTKTDDNINKSSCSFDSVPTLTPKTAADLAFDKKVKYWKDHQNDIKINKFNNNKWSELINDVPKTTSMQVPFCTEPDCVDNTPTPTPTGAFNTSTPTVFNTSTPTPTPTGAFNTSTSTPTSTPTVFNTSTPTPTATKQ